MLLLNVVVRLFKIEGFLGQVFLGSKSNVSLSERSLNTFKGQKENDIVFPPVLVIRLLGRAGQLHWHLYI